MRRIPDRVDLPVIKHGGATGTSDTTGLTTKLGVRGMKAVSLCHDLLFERFMQISAALEPAEEEESIAFAKVPQPAPVF